MAYNITTGDSVTWATTSAKTTAGDYWIYTTDNTGSNYTYNYEQITVQSYPYEEEEERTHPKYKNAPLKLKSKDKESNDMKNLYEVFVVDKDENILMDGKKVIAEDEREAEFNAEVSDILKKAGLKPKDVTILTMEIGEVKVKKEPQTVKVIKE